MSDEDFNPDDVVIPALLRAGPEQLRQRDPDQPCRAPGMTTCSAQRCAYRAGRAEQTMAVRPRALVRELRVSKQAASQLVDTLVLRGYLERAENPEDRRRIDVLPTERGRAAAAAIKNGVQSVDDELARMITPAQLAGLRAGLFALADIRDRSDEQIAAGAPAVAARRPSVRKVHACMPEAHGNLFSDP